MGDRTVVCAGPSGLTVTDNGRVRVVACGDVWEVHVDRVIASWARDRADAEREAARYARTTWLRF